MKNTLSIQIILALITTIISSCTTFNPGQSICDTIQGESILCQTAKDHNVSLEQIGSILIIVDYASIRSGLYTKDQAIDVLKQANDILSGPLAYRGFRTWLISALVKSKAPELIEISAMFPDSTAIMYKADQDILRGFIERHLANLGFM